MICVAPLLRGIVRICIVCGICSIVAACGAAPQIPLGAEAYIWQRQWTPGLDDSIATAQDRFSAWHVLAFESADNGELIAAAPQLGVLKRSARPVVLVVRLNGSRPPPPQRMLADRVHDAVTGWRAAGVVVSGVEIDHDCATARLDDYADLLARLRSQLPGDLSLSITVLPTWMGSAALPRVLAQIDTSVLQVHSILAPGADPFGRGLFNAQQARTWIDAYADVSPGAFRVALPAYGLRVGFDDTDRAMSVEAETPRDGSAKRSRELRVDPRDVAVLLHELQRARPAQLAGVIWFRLPTTDDRRAWRLPTLMAVMDDRPLQAQLRARVDENSVGAGDLVLSNDGTLDAILPAAIVVDAKDCSAGDALAGYSLEQKADGWRFLRATGGIAGDAILRAGNKRQIGWLRCASIAGVSIHEVP